MSECEPGASMTYDDWKELGFHVIKGEKSCGRNKNGQCVFSPAQVEEDDFDRSETGWDGDISD
jgi:hypothetical protein